MRFELIHSGGAVSKCLLLRAVNVALACVFITGTVYCHAVSSSPLTWSQKMAKSTMQRWPDGRFVPPETPWQWDYQLGVLSNGMDALWYNTANGAYFDYMKRSVDPFITANGSLVTYQGQAHSLDDILLGRQLLLLYRVTQDAKYYKAAMLLRKQLSTQQRNASGGFWHKKNDPNVMLLDDEYMVDPFYAEFANLFNQPQDFADITKQFVLLEEHTRDPKTGLLYQAWDETHQQPWANQITGTSQNFWARGMGWYMMALVDTLPYYPQDDPGRATLLAILNRTAAALVRYQDNNTGLWYQVLDEPNKKGNYFESSAACMFTYALAKGVRLGYLPQSYSENATRAWQGILTHFVDMEADGSVDISGTVKGIDLGGDPHHDGSFEYYVNAPVVTNDPKGIGSFLLASTEMELMPRATLGRGDSVMLDAWFNSQKRRNAAGVDEYFHYKWNDFSSDGFSLFGHIFRSYGIETKTLYTAPTYDSLNHAQFYIIVSPDISSKNPNPHYLQARDADQVARWVKEGGVLILMENDPANADIKHLDSLSDEFGIHFNQALSHYAIGHDLAAGRISVSGAGPVFHSPHMLFMKDTCTIAVKPPAISLLREKGDVVMATAKYGKGTVFAVIDPWLYNEYTDGRKLPKAYDNFAAGEELVRWLLQQTAKGCLSSPVR